MELFLHRFRDSFGSWTLLDWNKKDCDVIWKRCLVAIRLKCFIQRAYLSLCFLYMVTKNAYVFKVNL